MPENRADPDGRKLRLSVAILESFSDDPRPDPLVFISGGPGGKSLEFIPSRLNSPFWNRYRQDRDLVFYDQRGTGYSEPTFCPELNVALYTLPFRGLSVEEQQQQELAAVRDCRETMLAQGIDFAHYNSTTSAQDLADLRRALGVDKWNLFGVSYGTRLALVTLREAPEGIRSLVLDSVYPPNGPEQDDHARFVRSLRQAFDRCTADADCQSAFPRLEHDFYELLDDLEANPIQIEMVDTERFPGGRIVVDGTLMAFGVFQGFYSGDFVQVFPLLVREVGARNTDVLRALADGLVRDPHDMSQGLYFGVQCYEGFGRSAPDEVTADRQAYPELAVWTEALHYFDLCSAWHNLRAGQAFGEPVTSSVPVLLLAGDYDPITPPSAARLAAETLPNSTLVTVPGEGHGASPTSECTRGLLARFLENPGQALDTGCTKDIPEPGFITDVHMTPGISRLMASLGRGGLSLSVIAAGVMVLLLASALVTWPLAWLWCRLRHQPVRRPAIARRARLSAVVSALLGLGFLALLASAVLGAVEANPFLLAFGLPADSAWIFMMPWIAALAAIVTAAFAISAWRSGWWDALARVHYSLVALSGLGLFAWVASQGFL